MNYYARQLLGFLNATGRAFQDNLWDNFKAYGVQGLLIGCMIGPISCLNFGDRAVRVDVSENFDENSPPLAVNGEGFTMEADGEPQSSQQIDFPAIHAKFPSFTMPQPLWAYVAGGAAVGLVTLPVLATAAMVPFIAYRRQR